MYPKREILQVKDWSGTAYAAPLRLKGNLFYQRSVHSWCSRLGPRLTINLPRQERTSFRVGLSRFR